MGRMGSLSLWMWLFQGCWIHLSIYYHIASNGQTDPEILPLVRPLFVINGFVFVVSIYSLALFLCFMLHNKVEHYFE